MPDPAAAPNRPGALGALDAAARRHEQGVTLAAPRREYSPAARFLFVALDLVYGRRRTILKFRVLELIARVPYQAWEQAAYIAITHMSDRRAFARRIFHRVEESRAQQDNEQWHLFILEELLEPNERKRFWRYSLIPQAVAFAYYQLSWLLYVMKPAWSYRLNADFEDHAEHEYMELVAEHPEWDDTPVTGAVANEYGDFESLADVFRQIGYDERVHKEESLAHMRQPRFS